MDYLKRINEDLIKVEESSSSTTAFLLLTKWNHDVETFLASPSSSAASSSSTTKPSDASNNIGSSKEPEEDDDDIVVNRIESCVSMLHRGIVSSMNEPTHDDNDANPNCDGNNDNEANVAMMFSTANRFEISRKVNDIHQLSVYIQASKNLLRWYLQIYLERQRINRGFGFRPTLCPIRLLQANSTLDLMISLLKNLDHNNSSSGDDTDDDKNDGGRYLEIARNISLFLFYATYVPYQGDETSQKALSYLFNTLKYPQHTLQLLMTVKSCTASLALAMIRNLHNAIVSLEGAAKIILNTTYQFETETTNTTSAFFAAPWSPKENKIVDFPSILVDIIRWAVVESIPSFPGDENDDSDKRAELVVEVLGIFYALKIGQQLVPSKCETNIMQLVTTILNLPEGGEGRTKGKVNDDDINSGCIETNSKLVMQVKLSTISILMDSHPSFGEYLIAKQAIQPLLDVMEYQVTDIMENTKVDNSAAASFVPILVVLNKYSKANRLFRSKVKLHIFPLEDEEYYQSKVQEQQEIEAMSSSSAASRKKNMGPLSAPRGTLRWKLISMLTWTESHIKRCTGELLWTLCEEDATEFVHRVGFGNAIAILSSRGLAQMPSPSSSSSSAMMMNG